MGVVSQLNVRVGLNYLNFDVRKEDISKEVNEISMALDLNTVAMLLDWHPRDNNFRISGGVMVNKNKLALSAVPGEVVSINDTEYSISRLDGEVSFNQLAPYLGIGYGNAGKCDEDTHWRFSFDLGVMFQGTPEVKLSGTASDPSIQRLLDDAIAGESEDIKDYVTPFTVYPVLSFGVSYVF